MSESGGEQSSPCPSSETEEEGEEVSRIRVLDSNGSHVLFKIIPNEPDGNCMFRALSQALTSEEIHHARFRQQIVSYVTENAHWEKFFPFVRNQHEHLDKYFKKQADSNNNNLTIENDSSVPNEKKEEERSGREWREMYRSYMTVDRVYGTLQELLAAAELFNFNLLIVRQMSTLYFSIQHFKDTPNFNRTFYFLFSGLSAEDGHFEFLDPIAIARNDENENEDEEEDDEEVTLPILCRGFYKQIYSSSPDDANCIVIRELLNPPPLPHETKMQLEMRSERQEVRSETNIRKTSPPQRKSSSKNLISSQCQPRSRTKIPSQKIKVTELEIVNEHKLTPPIIKYGHNKEVSSSEDLYAQNRSSSQKSDEDERVRKKKNKGWLRRLCENLFKCGFFSHDDSFT